MFTAFNTPFPQYLSSLSLSSNASLLPVDAPDGTAATALIPFSVVTSTSTVGFPLESRISLAFMFVILLINIPSNYLHIHYTIFFDNML